MASSEVDQKFLGRLAKLVEKDNPLLGKMLFKLLGLSLSLAEQLVLAKKHRRPDAGQHSDEFLELVFHIIWLSREGLKMLEQYVLPMVGHYGELKVLAYKLRASFYHIFVLFHNTPAVSPMGISTPQFGPSSAMPTLATMRKLDKGKGVARDEDLESNSSIQPTHPLEGGPVGPPPGFADDNPAGFLMPTRDYLPAAQQYFSEAVKLADELLWGSHSLRLSVKTEYAAFLFECVHDREGSRRVAKETVAEVYEAEELIDDDMFSDACELVTVLGKMMKRGLGSSATSKKGRTPGSSAPDSITGGLVPPPGMENPI